MTLEIRPGITIRRPRREVATVIFDPGHDDAWFETLQLADAGTDVIDVGSTRVRSIRFLLRDKDITLQVTGHEPERFLELRAEEPYPLLIRQDLESIPEGTLVRIRFRLELSGMGRLLVPLIRHRLRRSLLGDLMALKAMVENSPHRGIAAARPATQESRVDAASPPVPRSSAEPGPIASRPVPAPAAPSPRPGAPPSGAGAPGLIKPPPVQPAWPVTKGSTTNW
jgi:hypothetical protein